MKTQITSEKLQKAANDIIIKVAKKIHLEQGLSIEESKKIAYEVSMPVIRSLFA